MAQDSKIEWTDHTVNLWWGCTEVHAGCDNCYAKTLAHRRKPHLELWGNDRGRLLIKSAFADLEKYQRKAAKLNEVHRIFINSMSDLFDNSKEAVINNEGHMVTDGMHYYPVFLFHLRDQLFENIDAGMYPNLLLLLLTKRPGNINKMTPEGWKINPPKNIMFGTSPVDQKTANKLIPQLLKIKGHKFLSVEPQLGPIDFTQLNVDSDGFTNSLSGISFCNGMNEPLEGEKIDWVIQGGESGPGKRPFEIKWAYDVQKQCKENNVAYFFKQIDKVQPVPQEFIDTREFPKL